MTTSLLDPLFLVDMCLLFQAHYLKEGGHISNLQGSLKTEQVLWTLLGRSFLDQNDLTLSVKT